MQSAPQNIPLILLGSGRSGTTLMFRLLNSQDDIFISGEHGGFLRGIGLSYNQVNIVSDLPEKRSLPKNNPEIIKNRESKGSPFSAWENSILSKKLVKEKLKNLFEELFLINKNYKYFGFKEILYPTDRDDKTIDFIVSEYPLSKFIFIFRNPLETIKSQYVNFNLYEIEQLAKKWDEKNQLYLHYYEKYPKNITFVDYNKLISDDQERVLESIGSFLNMKWDHEKSFDVFSNGGNITKYQNKIIKIFNTEMEDEIKNITMKTYENLRRVEASINDPKNYIFKY